MHAAGTIGTTAATVSWPRPRSSHQRITPEAASSPNALPPLNTQGGHLRHRRQRRQQVDVPRRRPAAAHLHRPHGPGRRHDHGAARARLGVRPVAHADPGDVGHHRGRLRLAGRAPVCAALGDPRLHDRWCGSAGRGRPGGGGPAAGPASSPARRASRGRSRSTRRPPPRPRQAVADRAVQAADLLVVERARRPLGVDPRLEEGLVHVHVPEPGDQHLVEQHRLDRARGGRRAAPPAPAR